jgi:hypothetical protein
MIGSILLAALGTAHAQDPVAVYDCEQTNPMQYTDFNLRFRAIVSHDPDRPYTARLWDNETDSVRIASRELRQREAFRIEGYQAYVMGQDAVGTLYVLRVPYDGDLTGTFDAQILQVFGHGIEQWVNEFTCTER